MKTPGAQRTFRTMSTYAFGVLVLLVAGLAPWAGTWSGS